MKYNSDSRDLFSFSSTHSGQRYIDGIMRELLLPYNLTSEGIANASAKDRLLLTTYLLTAVSAPLCSILLSPCPNDLVKSRLSCCVRDGLLRKHSVSFYASSNTALPDARVLYSLSEKGERYVCCRFDLPELQKWERTSSSLCMHTYQNTLTVLQLFLQRIIDADRHRDKAYVQLWKSGTDQFDREYMIDKRSYRTDRRDGRKMQKNLIADSIYTIYDPRYEKKEYYKDNYSRKYCMAPFQPIVSDDSRTAQLPLHIFVETDMRTERNPVIIEKLARYADAQTISRTGSYSYRDSCILFSCYDSPPVPSESWIITNKELNTLMERAQKGSEGVDAISRDDFPREIQDLPEALQNGYNEINEFYNRGSNCKTAAQLLNRYQADKSNLRLPMLSQYKAEYQTKRCRLRISQVYKCLYDELKESDGHISYTTSQTSCTKVIREFLEGLHCYFLPSSTIWHSATRMYHNPDFLSWIIATYFANMYAVSAGIKSRLNAPKNGITVFLSTYEQTPQDKVPSFDEGLCIQFPQCITFCRSDTDTDRYTFIFEDLSDLGAWVRLTEYFKKYPKGTKDIRIVCLYESEEEVKLFSKTTGISGIMSNNLIQSPAGIAYISIRSYSMLKNPTLENWIGMSGEEKEAWAVNMRSYRLYACQEKEGVVFRDANHRF